VEERLDYVEDLREIAIDAALPIHKDLVLIELRAKAAAVYEVEVSTSAFWEQPEAVPTGLALSADERTATFSGFADVVLVFDAAYDVKAKTITRPQLERVAPEIDERSAHMRERRKKQALRALGELRARRA
jgi:hypothetical protein